MSEYIRKVKDGKIVIETPLFEDGDELIVQIDKAPKRHSDRARRYYFGAVVKYIAAEMGETKDVVHHMMTASFFPIETHNPITGEVVVIGKSLSVMTKDELMELTKKAEGVAQLLNIKLPTEDDYWDMLLKESNHSPQSQEE